MTTPPWPSPVPDLLLLTDRAQLPAGRDLVAQVTASVVGGARAVVLREKDLPRPDRRRLADALLAVLRPVGGLLLVASDVALAREVRADGVHLAAADPFPDPADGPLVVGRSTHDLDELVAAQAERVGYATISPIFASPSKPGYGPALGLDGLQAAAARVLVPVFALGGVTPERASASRRAGAAGVAVMGEVMRAVDPSAVVADLLTALGAPGSPASPSASSPSVSTTASAPSTDPIGARP